MKGRRICVVAAPGDRRDDDVVEIGQAAARGNFDHYLCRRDDDPRGRAVDEVPRLLRDTLLAAGIADERITLVPDEQEAIDTALRMARINDLVLLFADALARSWKQVVHFRVDGQDDAAADTPDNVAPATMLQPPPALPQQDSRADRLLGDDVVIVRDERGVHIARDVED